MAHDKKPDVAAIQRQTAQSGRVDYAEPVVLHETSRTRVTFVAFYVPHSDHTEMSIKIVTQQKAPPPNSWVVVEEKSISLQESGARELLRALQQHFAVSTHDQDGEYIAIRVAGGEAHLSAGHSPEVVAQALLGILGQPDIVQHLATRELGTELAAAFRSVIRLQELRSAVATLRQRLDDNVVEESVYQEWCEEHTWAFGNAYVMRDDVRNISAGDRIDLLLPTVIAGYRDIVELKRPDMPVLLLDQAHANYYFSADVSKAIGQCHRYLDVLHEEAAKGLRDHPDVVAYHPRAIIVIGRSRTWEEAQLRALHGLNSRLSGITVMTYDQLLAQGERLVDVVSSQARQDDRDVV